MASNNKVDRTTVRSPAHNRTVVATKMDVDKALVEFPVTAEELLHLANLK